MTSMYTKYEEKINEFLMDNMGAYFRELIEMEWYMTVDEFVQEFIEIEDDQIICNI